MAFEVKFWNFPKKVNSTARPSGEGTAYGCVLLSSSGIVDPMITLERGLNSVPDFNYCYIPAFSRYYFVREWTFSNSLWSASLSVDVLATYKDQIAGKELYVLRSSADYDGTITDTYYPVLNSSTAGFYNANKHLVEVDNGRYVVGVVGNPSGTSNGAVSYMVFTTMEFNAFRAQLFSDNLDFFRGTEEQDIGIEAIGASLTKMLFNPFEYIVSCKWLPKTPLIGGTASVGIGWWIPEDLGSVNIASPNVPITDSVQFTIPKHPLAEERGLYLNTEPFSRYRIFIPTVGIVPIDGTKIAASTTLTLEYFCDPVTGDNFCRLLSDRDGTLVPLDVYPSKLSMDVQLSNNASNVGSIVTDVAGTIGSIATSTAVGNYGGDVSSIASATASMFQPHISAIGTNGGKATICRDPLLYAEFYDVAEEDNDHHGRPLCKNKVLSEIPGYIECLDGDMSLSGATSDENKQVKGYMEGGFFLE